VDPAIPSGAYILVLGTLFKAGQAGRHRQR
jgi:hypothetical protein